MLNLEFTLNEKKRKKLTTVINVLIAANCLASFILIFYALFNLYFLHDKAVIGQITIFTLTMGVYLVYPIIIVILMVVIMHTINRKRHKMFRFVKDWVYQLTLSLIILSGLIFILYFNFSLPSIEFYLKSILESIARNYVIYLDAKQALDTIQIYHECCGIDQYSNWFDIFWKDSNTSVPYSCCRLEHIRPCMSQNLVNNVKAIETIYSRGCASTLSRHVEKLIINGVFMFATICLLSSLLLALYRIIDTSIQNAVVTHGDPNGTGKGYIFKLRDRKQTIDENFTDSE